MDEPDLEPLRDALVAAVDGSAPAGEALRWAAGLAEGLGQPLHVVRVWSFAAGPGAEQGEDESPSVDAWQAETERRLSALLAEQLGERPAMEVRPRALHGNPTPVLLAITRVAAHLVVGSRGRSGLAGLLLGSTTEDLVKEATCPVTVVHPRQS